MKTHFICFICRKGFKTKQKTLKCPECGNEMDRVGVTFRVPKKTNIKAWKKVETEYSTGNKFDTRWWPF